MNLATLRSLPQRRRVRLSFYWLAGIFVFFILFGFFGVPPLARWTVESQGSKLLGRVVSVEKVSFNPFTLDAKVDALRIAEADGKAEFLSLKQLQADVDLSSIWHGGAVLQTLRVVEPSVHIVRVGEQRYNFSDILDRFAAQPKSDPGEPAKFSLNNIHLVDGRIVFDDQPVKRQHVIEKLNLGIPFVSNLPAKVDIFETPKIEAVVNGAALALEGKVKPFAGRREATLEIKLAPLDLTPYLAYAPGKLPVMIERAKLETDLRVVWSDGGGAAGSAAGAGGSSGQSLTVDGKAKLLDVVTKDNASASLAGFSSLMVDIAHLEPLAAPMVAKVSSVQLDGLNLSVSRAKDGVLNLQQIAAAGRAGETKAAPVSQSAPQAANAKPPVIQVDKIVLSKAAVHWQDDAVPGGFKLNLSPLDVQVTKVDLGGDTPAQVALKATADTGESFSHQGEAIIRKGQFKGHVTAEKLSLEHLRPYFDAAVGPGQIQGLANAEADYVVETGKAAPSVRIDKANLKLADFSVSDKGEAKGGAKGGGGQPLVNVPEFSVGNVALDLDKREVSVGSVDSKDARWRLVRSHEGKINLLEALLPAQADTNKPAVAKASKTAAKAAEEKPWAVKVGLLDLAGWGLRFDDRSGSAPVVLDVSEFGLQLKDWANQAGNMASADIKAKVNKKGRLAINGRFGSEPLKGDLKLDLKSVDLLSIQPYIDKHYKVLVTQGAVSAKGALGFDLSRPDHPQARYAGSLALEDFNSLDQLNDADFLRWKRFAFNGVKFELSPLSVATSEVRLDDFYTRLILDSQGRFNLRELATPEEENGGSPGGTAAPVTAASASAPTPTPASASKSAPVASASAPAAPTTPLPNIKVDKFILTEGHVNYSDRFIKPNYDANLRSVNGTLSGLSTDQSSLASLDLKARLDGSAPVDVSGQLNPFRKDSFLDIKANVSDVDLTGVSTYAAKYVGYGIEKGKLSMKLQYKIRDRKLTAENQVNLDQLTFGQKVDSPEATKLPVLFAVALLKNGRGEIDINLPISGTLDDPQFSVGGIIVRVVVNLISKAITAPFALIGSLFGGGEELSAIDFPAGLTTLPMAGEEKLNTLAKALKDRPALRLEIAGVADIAADRIGLKRAALEGKMRTLKAAAMVKRGQEVGEVDKLEIDKDEYPQWLEAVYSAEKIPNKPRNAIGLTKKLPPEEMEKMLLDYLVVTDADVQALGAKRAQLVRDWFIEKGGIDPDRVFLLNAASASEKKEGKPASPRVEFSLK